MRTSRLAPAFLGALLCVSAGWVAWGQSSGRPTLHEYVAPPEGPKGNGIILDPTAEDEAGANDTPFAIRQGDRYVPRPADGLLRNPGEAVLGRSGFGADRITQMPLDEETSMDGTLSYSDAFDPSVVPFKRMSVFDSARSNALLGVASTVLTTVDVGATTDATRDLFWASLLLDLTPGEDVPVPSVAPDMRIISAESEPTVALTFAKDGADNFTLRTDDPKAKGPHRVILLLDASAAYFGGAAPAGYTFASVAGESAPAHMPPALKKTALRLASEIGLLPETELRAGLDKLVEYFRAFKAGDPPPGDDLYVALTRAQRGVCRHRAFAFMITANALGLPTRYVTNEAHAFVEVWLPVNGWLRIDLGGAAVGLQVDNAENRTMHRPRTDDAFPRPDAYENNYSQLEGAVGGLSADQLAQSQGTGAMRDTSPLPPGTVDLPRGLPPLRSSLTSSRIQIEAPADQVFRGDTLTVAGRILGNGAVPVAGAPVEVYLKPRGAAATEAVLLGQTVSDAQGGYRAVVVVPTGLPLGPHEIFVATPGTGPHGPGLSR